MNKANENKSSEYIIIQDWMITELHLKGVSLLIYAVIYGFSRIENQYYTGSINYLAQWCNSSRQGVHKALSALIKDGLIELVINSGITVGYKAERILCNNDVNSVDVNSVDTDVNSVDTDNINNIDIIYNNIYINNIIKVCKTYEKEFHSLVPTRVRDEIETYINDGIEDRLICEVIKRAALKNIFNWNYVNKIIISSQSKGIKTYDDFVRNSKLNYKASNRIDYGEVITSAIDLQAYMCDPEVKRQ